MSSTSVQDPTETGGDLIAASKVNGTAVYDQSGEKLGSVHDVMLEKVSGRAQYAILSIGGFLGIGDKYHPVPWKELTYDTGRGGFTVGLDKGRLEAAPSLDAGEVGTFDGTRGRAVDEYYGDPAFR
ncbi:MAG: PRC-barrel domain-containing protein [Gluconacetobacter diazotrophicus]|nr:PRC-barrel domain-containing protein [Gluconacetobacter diazotrophicus]